MGSHKIDIYVLYAPAFLSFFCKYLPDDGPLRPTPVVNSDIINIIQLCQTEYLYSLFLLMHFKHNKMSSKKKTNTVHLQYFTEVLKKMMPKVLKNIFCVNIVV